MWVFLAWTCTFESSGQEAAWGYSDSISSAELLR